VFEIQLADPFHQRTWFRQYEDLVTPVADCPRQLDGVDLRSPKFHGMRIDKYFHGFRSLTLNGSWQANTPPGASMHTEDEPAGWHQASCHIYVDY
jgi:hypothetical protein